MDEWNEQDFADGIIDSTLDELRDQSDRAGDISIHGSTTINPQVFQPANQTALVDTLASTPRQFWDQIIAQLYHRRIFVLGPISFEKKFDTLPDITFGEATLGDARPIQIGIQDADNIPFMVHCSVRAWVWTNGVVDGFYLGLYALTLPPAGLTSHTVSWQAQGKSSRYSQDAVEESWNDAYDYNDPEYLHDDVTEEYGGDDTFDYGA